MTVPNIPPIMPNAIFQPITILPSFHTCLPHFIGLDNLTIYILTLKRGFVKGFYDISKSIKKSAVIKANGLNRRNRIRTVRRKGNHDISLRIRAVNSGIKGLQVFQYRSRRMPIYIPGAAGNDGGFHAKVG